MTPEQQKVHEALSFIIPILDKLNLRWCITGGFACYVCGVKRPITDIDIDIEASKDGPVFVELLKLVESKITSPLEHLVDQNYDNYNFEITVGGIIIDICPMAEMNIFDKETNTYVNFYQAGFPDIETVDFLEFKLPLLAKELIIKNKEMLQREIDFPDIAGLKALL